MVNCPVVKDNKARSFWAGKKITDENQQNGRFFVRLKKNPRLFFSSAFFLFCINQKRTIILHKILSIAHPPIF